MSEPFLAEIRMVGFTFAPSGWAFCDGQLMPIEQNQALYSLLGNTYGGDMRTTFALPDLRGRTPLHKGEGHALGEMSGAEDIALTTSEIPSHTHSVKVYSGNADTRTPTNAVLASQRDIYTPPSSGDQHLGAETVQHVGEGIGHDNMQPFTTLNFCIALQGSFPPHN